MAFSFGLPFFMLMKVLTPAFFARKDTKTPMYVAMVSLLLNASLNYYLAFMLDFGHIGIALGSSIAALISVLILEFILYKDGFIKIKNFFNRFNIMILFSNLSLILFLNFYTNLTNFIEFGQVERVLYLSIEVIISIIIYGAVSRLILRKPIQTLFE